MKVGDLIRMRVGTVPALWAPDGFEYIRKIENDEIMLIVGKGTLPGAEGTKLKIAYVLLDSILGLIDDSEQFFERLTNDP